MPVGKASEVLTGGVVVHQGDEAGTPKFTELNDLSGEKSGGEIIFATDDWFAGKNRIKQGMDFVQD